MWAANERLRDGERGEKVAIKKINNCFVQATEAKRILRELRILRHLSHPNVVRIRDVLDPTNELNYSDLWVVFDFVDLDLRKLIASPQTITVQHVQWISHQVCAGNSVEPSQPAVRCLWKLPQAVHTARHGPSPRTVHGLARCRSRPIRSSGHSTTYTLLTCCTVT